MPRKKASPDEKMKQISVNLPPELLTFVDSLRHDPTESSSLVVRRIIREYKENKESK